MAERVRAAPGDVTQVGAVRRQPWFRGGQLVEPRRINRQELRLNEGRAGTELGEQQLRLLQERLPAAGADVLVAAHLRICNQPAAFAVDAAESLEGIGQDLTRGRQPAGEGIEKGEL